MFCTLLLIAMCSPSENPASDRKPQIRSAEILRNAIDSGHVIRKAGGSGLDPLLEAARTVSEQYGESPLGKSAGELVESSRWKAATDDLAAAVWLEAELELVFDDLSFEPVMEADLPHGFPGPTPLREIELKQYPSYRSAITNIGAMGSGAAFWKLFLHISMNDIAMTAPVEMSYDVDDKGARQTKMAFLYGDPETGAPRTSGLVKVSDKDSDWFVSLGCRGWESDLRVAQSREELLAWIKRRPELSASGEVRVLGYNSPSVRGNKRYFEVQLPVKVAAKPLINFSAPGEVQKWNPVNDTVMGGRSKSMLGTSDGGMGLFSGDLSLDNNGGFASVRSGSVAGLFVGAERVVVKFCGDGKTYKLRMRSSATGPLATFQASFETQAGVWSEHVFEASDFTAVWRGRVLRDLEPLAFGEVTELGFMISDKQSGTFALELAAIELR